MHILITAQQTRHYMQFGWIEFEAFLSEKELQQLQDAAETVLAERLKTPRSLLEVRCTQTALYQQGRDLWRDAPALKTLFCSQMFGAAASSLSGKQQIFLACDQWIPAQMAFAPLQMETHLSFQQLACGCLLSLKGADRGNARFIHPKRFPLFASDQLLIAFGTPRSVYIHNALDPCNHSLKQLGYSFGDPLNPACHPPCKL